MFLIKHTTININFCTPKNLIKLQTYCHHNKKTILKNLMKKKSLCQKKKILPDEKIFI